MLCVHTAKPQLNMSGTFPPRLHAISKQEKYYDTGRRLQSQKVSFNTLSPDRKNCMLNVDGGSEAANPSALLKYARQKT